ncbi:MAG TPA: winged helix-turn-helix domain-containing protein [Pyrinomonadaceae bacterium]|nr:winged helix-turn-helix domain-containing protein [Pyrinomonadaceae bacterium]
MLLKGAFQFGDFVLDTEERALTRNGASAPLPPKALKLLLVLVENRSHILEKDELIEKVWADTFVEEGNLPYTIRLLRKTLGDDADAPKYIETIPRRGYRFIAECHEVRPNRTKQSGIVSAGTAQGDDDLLIGREKEIAEITELLAKDRVRLVTLTGTGGTGKTRLAREIEQRIADEYADKVFFIDLAAVTDPLLVASTISYGLGIKEVGTKPAADVLANFFQARPALLILDNFEQIVSAAVLLVQLLRAAPELKILVTSREPLKLSVETEYRVPPLALPATGTKETIDNMMRFGAVQLFARRAMMARSDLELTDNDGPSLSTICRMLDGLPLALELAASRVKVLSIQEVSEKLENRLALLTGGARDIPDRQKTMRSTIAWSYGLLTDAEKRVFVLLSVFEGSFTFKAAEKVLIGADSAIAETDIVDSISSLSEKGLIEPVGSRFGELRFRMLVVIRDYATEIRPSVSSSERIRRSHAVYVRDFCEDSAPHLFASESPEWLDRFAVEGDNIRAAINWALDNDIQMAAQIVAAVRYLAALRLHIREIRSWLEEILKRASELPTNLQNEMYTGLGVVSQYQLDYSTSRWAHQKSRELSRKLGDKKLLARALRGLGAIDYLQLDLASARAHLIEALAISRSISDEFGEAASLGRLGDICNAENNYTEARRLITEALQLFRKIGYKQGVSAKLTNLTITEFVAGDYDAARQRHAESLEAALEIGDDIDFRVHLEVAAALSVVDAKHELAARLSGAALARCEELVYFHEPVEQRFRNSYLEKLKAEMTESDFKRCFDEGRCMSAQEALDAVLKAAEGSQKTSRRLRLVGGSNI